MASNNLNRRTMATASILAITAFAGASQAYAQDTGLALETITVTGTKGFGTDVTQVGSFRGAKLIDTPMTVNVLPKDLLNAQFAVGMNEALRSIAGVTNSQTSTVVTSGESVRGIPLDNRNAYRLDGSLPIINLLELPTEDKERVELLKGASGLYYGFASPAGVVNLTMKRPTTDSMVGLKLVGNEYGALGAAIDVGGTTAGGFGYRLNGLYGGANYGIKNATGNRSLLAGAFDYHPIDSVAMQVDYEHIYKSMPEPGFFQLQTATSTAANPYPTVALPDIHQIDPKNNLGTNLNTYRAEETNILSHNVWSIDESWALTADVGDSHFQRQRFQPSVTITNAAANLGTFTQRASLQSSENQNGRLDLSGTFETFGLVHNVSVGYTDNVRDSYAPSATNVTCAGGAYTAANTGGATFCNAGISSVNGVAVNYANNLYTAQLGSLGKPQVPVLSTTTTRIDDSGGYLFDRVSFMDYIDVLGGVRFGNYHENVVKPIPSQTFHAAPTTVAGSVILKPLGDDTLSVYGSYIEALQTTSAAGTTALNVGFQPPPTPSFQRELGVKYIPWKGIIAQASYFNIRQGNATIDASGIYGLNGSNKFDGFDASITGEVTDDLSIIAGGLLEMAKVVNATPTCGPGTVVGTIGGKCAVFTPTLLGLDVENTPKASGSLFAEYKLRGLSDALDGIAVNAGIFYTGARYTGTTAARARVGDYTLLDLGASYSTDVFEYPLTFRVAGHNVTNRRYWAATGQGLLAINQPSNFDFSIETHL
jgi:iron complex outermembrane receptor protein